jgi:surface polysaccharide O-acyltransferase-like enzyme
MSAERDRAIEMLRWVSMLAVVAHHAVFPGRYSPRTLQAIAHFREFVAWCVPAFFAISGALLRTEGSYAAFAAVRSRRLLVPYLTVSVLSFSAMCAVAASGLRFLRDSSSLDPKLFLVKILVLEGYGPQLYFLTYLFVVSLIVAGLRRFLSAWATTILLVVLLVLQSALWLAPRGSLGPGLDKFILFSVPFALGHWLAQLKRTSPRGAWLVLSVSTLVSAVASLAFRIAWPFEIVVPFWIYLLLSRSGLPRLGASFLDRWSSGAVFLWHAPLVLPALSISLDRIGVTQGWNYAFSCLLSVPLSLGIDRLVRRIGLGGLISL